MCQACVPGVSVDGYDCDSDLDLESDDGCACPHDHKEHHHEHEHEDEHNHEQKDINKDNYSQVVTFPSDPFFTRLINATHQYQDQIIINDSAQGLQLTYAQFLQDVQALRLKIQSAVPADVLDASGVFKEGVDANVGVLAEIQYPFFVASLAILAMGGVIVPMGHEPEPEQAVAVLNESKSTVLVFDPTQTDLATAIKKEDESITQLPIEINQTQKNPEKLGFATADDVVIAPERPALLLFTDSDTPAVLTRQTFYDQATGPGSTDGAQPYSSMAGKLDSNLLRALEVMGFDSMTPVQQRVLTELPNWRSDCLVQAKTGTGKTLAFLLPALHCLLQGYSPPRGQVGVLIITPTRELAQQIAKSCDQLTSQLAKPLECHIAVGGTARASAFSRFIKGAPSVLVATPGRLKDYLSDPSAAEKLSNIQTLVLDEADTMLETGFIADVKQILRLIPPKSTGWQGMCFSATVPPKVKDVVKVVLKPGYSSLSTIEENEAPTHERVPQYHVLMPGVADTFTTLASLLKLEIKSSSKIIVFGVTANMVALFAGLFSQGLTPLRVFEIHSRLNQSARTKTTAQFKEAAAGILFASDVIGRGMDFPNVDLVIQVGLPSNGEQYVHRVGRTARAGNDGRAIILLTETESFFMRNNRHLPIKPHPQTDAINEGAASCADAVTQAMYAIDEEKKQRAYSSFIGFFAGSGLLRQLRLDKAGLVQLANDMAMNGMACPEPPPMEKKTIGKMGLKGVPGFNYASGGDSFRGSSSRPRNNPQGKIRDALSPGAGGDRGGVEKRRGGGRGGRGRGRGGRGGKPRGA
ncbi:hypothetical protein MW887_001870 [Aspergillus wentii]|nr:hypothetical protein MW887_001870 [Aspergillus wentii]